MSELLYYGDHRIVYQAAGFQSGQTITMDIYKPDNTWDTNKTLTHLASGLYYIDYAFPTSGSYIARFYENGNLAAAQTYRVFKVGSVANVDEIADAVWDEQLSEHLGVGTTGYNLSSAAVGGTGGGATAAQVWSYPNRTLTQEISTGEGRTRYIAAGRGSPWTQSQKNKVLKKLDVLTDIMEKLDNKIDRSEKQQKKSIKEIKGITSENLDRLKATRDIIQKIIKDKKSQDKSINRISEKLDKLDEELVDIKNDVQNNVKLKEISNQIDSLCDMLAKSLSDEELEELALGCA